MARPDYDVGALTRDLLDNNWNTNNTDRPDIIRLTTEDNSGNHTKGIPNPATSDYIRVHQEGEATVEYQAQRLSRDISMAAFLNWNTPDSRTRFYDMFDEIDRILQNAKRRRDNTPGGWDTVDVSYTINGGERTKYWQGSATVTYHKYAMTE
jgi:hypothetical protein